MKGPRLKTILFSSALLLMFGGFTANAQTTHSEHPEPLPAIDVSLAQISTRVAAQALVSSAQRNAVSELEKSAPGIKIRWNALTGTPAKVHSNRSLLTAPTALSPTQVLRNFMSNNAALFGLSESDLSTLVHVRDSDAPGSAQISTVQSGGMRHIALDQHWQGRQIYPATIVGSVTNRGQLVSVSGDAIREVGTKVNTDEPVVTAKQAVAAAAENLGVSIEQSQINPAGAAEGAELRQTFTGGESLTANVPVRLIYFLASSDEVRLVWEVTIGSRNDPYLYQVFIDATNQEVLYRQSLTDADVPQWRVYFQINATPTSDPKDDYIPLDNPAPLSPGPATPDGSQGALVPSVILTTNGDLGASSGGWLAGGINTTSGNNVQAFVDSNSNSAPDPGEQPTATIVDVSGTPTRSFDFPTDFTQPPETAGNEAAATVQTFVMANWWHDRLEKLGFDESAGNFQLDNGVSGGADGDPILARLHVGTNNSTFGTPASDGTCCPTLNAFTWTGPDPDRDSGFDNEILIHEFTHGLTNRIIGGPNVRGLTSSQGRGLGEGYSDLYALLLVRTPDEDPDGAYTVGGYSTFLLPPAFGQPANWDDNYTFGIRHFPYTTDMCKNSFTLLDMQPATYDLTPIPSASCSATPPVSPWLATRSGGVHDMGEIWASNVWEVRRNLVDKHGAAVGNELTLQLLTDSLFNLAQNPTFIDARDAVLSADLARTNGDNRCEIWRGFAKRGMGLNAATPLSGAFTEDYSVPRECEVRPEVNNFRYAAKLVCGVSKDPETFVLTPGLYATTINIHNPGPKEVKFTKTLALTYPPKEQRPGKVFEIATDKLKPEHALSTDCDDIRRRVFNGNWPESYVEGFVIIKSPTSLDVVGVYTKSALNPDEGGVSIDVEPVPEREMDASKGQPDLIPQPDDNGFFCRRTPDGLTVTVKNQGSGNAAGSTTRIDYGSFGIDLQATPGLTAGNSVDLVSPIPFGCFNPDCEFRIQVDSDNAVGESNEGNNTASGLCLG